ncbi:MAG: hypothetical protein IJT82_00165 [Schwartzia sp.]|nr:hypothetical protein [Schwartzia sp. (in: firmicutes)]
MSYDGIDKTFGFEQRYEKRTDDQGMRNKVETYYRKKFPNGAYAIACPADGEDEMRDDNFHVLFVDEAKGIRREQDVVSPIGGKFFIDNALEMDKNMK